MRVLLGTTKLSKAAGGVRTHVVDLARLLKAENAEVIVCSAGGEYAQQLEKEGIKHFTIPFDTVRGNKMQILGCIIGLLKVCRENKVDIIHCHGQSVIAAANICRRILGIPYVWTCHNSQQPMALHKILKMGKFPAIAVSSDIKHMLVHGFGFDESACHVVFNGINIGRYAPVSADERRSIRAKFGISNEAYVISDVAALNAGKGQILLLEAVKTVQETIRNKNLIVFLAGGTNTKGDEEYAAQLAAYAEQNHIELKLGGYQSARDVYGMSDLACLPSYVEGFSISALEAFIMKCPVIRSESAGSSDVAECCYVIPVGDSQALAEQIKYAICHEDETKALVAKAYETVKDKFCDQAMIDGIMAVYQGMLRNG